MSTFRSDDDFTDQSPSGADIIHRPFLNAGNLSNYLVERFVLQELSDFSTPALGTTATAADGPVAPLGDPLYLVDESPLDPGYTVIGKARASRLWAPEWADIIDYGQILFSLPDLRGLSYDPGTGAVVPTYNETSRSIEIPISASTAVTASVRFFTAGSWTFLTSSSINWNDSSTTILAALDAVDSKFFSVKIYAGRMVLQWRASFNSTINPPPDLTDFSLAGLTAAGAISYNDLGYSASFNQYLHEFTIYPETYQLTAVGHGLSTGDNVYLLDTSRAYSLRAKVTRLTDDVFTAPNNVTLADRDIDEFSLSGFYYVRAKPLQARYVHEFFFPGVTAGIVDASDIPAVDIKDYDFALFQAMVDQEDEVVIAATQPTRLYPGVYQRVLTCVTIQDLYD